MPLDEASTHLSKGRRCHSSSLLTMVLLLFVLILQTSKAAEMSSEARQAFHRSEVLPDVVSQVPAQLAQVHFPNGLQADLGNQLSPDELREAPTVSWEVKSATKQYALAMVDPDAPSRNHPTNREWLHWLVVNIPSNAIGKGKELTPYAGPSPPKGTGPHRYVILVFEQSSRVQQGRVAGRGNFNIRTFAEKHGFGKLLAGNFFVAQN